MPIRFENSPAFFNVSADTTALGAIDDARKEKHCERRAIAWLLAKDAVSSVILGASKLPQLEDNLGAINVRLTAAEVAELDAATVLPPVYPNWVYDRFVDQPLAQAQHKL